MVCFLSSHLSEMPPSFLTCLHAEHSACPSLCEPRDCSPPGSSAHGILQAGILEWVATPSFRGSSQPKDRTCDGPLNTGSARSELSGHQDGSCCLHRRRLVGTAVPSTVGDSVSSPDPSTPLYKTLHGKKKSIIRVVFKNKQKNPKPQNFQKNKSGTPRNRVT